MSNPTRITRIAPPAAPLKTWPEYGGRLSDSAVSKGSGPKGQIACQDEAANRSAHTTDYGVAECAEAHTARQRACQ